MLGMNLGVRDIRSGWSHVLAPVLVLWLGYGLASKVAMATLIIYFPVTAAFYDGLRRTAPGWLDLARSLNGRPGRILWHLRVPAALPALGSGLRIAAAVASSVGVISTPARLRLSTSDSSSTCPMAVAVPPSENATTRWWRQ